MLIGSGYLRSESSESLFRLHLGPYRTPDEARAVADRIRAQVSLAPLLVVR